MKIEVIQEKFSTALLHINKAISTNPNIPVLANVLLETDKGNLRLSSTNLEIGINAQVGADIKENGRITVSARLLFEFINTLKPGKIQLILKGEKFVVNSVDNNAEFFVIPAEDFPSVPTVEGEPITKINAQEFSKALDKTIFTASTDNSRPVLTGILTKITKRKLVLVAVDGYRLSRKELKIKGASEEDFSEIIPAKSLLELNKIIKDISSDKDEVEIYALKNKNQVVFKIGNIELASRLIEGDFPAYEDILPTEKNNSFSILKQEFADSVKIVNIFARNVIGYKTRFSIDSGNNKLIMSADVVDVGRNDSKVDIANILGEDLTTAYNAKFLQDMINAIEGDEIIYETSSVTSPGVFKDKKDSGYLHIIMPMMLE